MDRYSWLLQKLSSDKKILDIGCADARIWKELGWYGKENLVLVDINEFDHPFFCVADAHNLPFENKSFDIVILSEILEHVRDPQKVLKEASRIAREKILITVPDKENWISLYYPKMPAWYKLILEGRSFLEIVQRANHGIVRVGDPLQLFHVRYYTEDSLKNELENACLKNYEMVRLIYNGYAFFAVEVFL